MQLTASWPIWDGEDAGHADILARILARKRLPWNVSVSEVSLHSTSLCTHIHVILVLVYAVGLPN